MMRVISQDGTIDVPYELSTIIADGNKIFVVGMNDSGERCWQLAVYTNAEKAQKFLGKMHNMYMQVMKVSGTNKGQTFYQTVPRIYRFPQDELIEV